MPRKKKSIEEIEQLAAQGKDVSAYFSTPVLQRLPKADRKTDPPRRRIQRVNLDLTQSMLHELDELAAELNISRQACIKMMLRFQLDHHRLAKKSASG